MTTLFGIKNCDSVKKARRWLDGATVDYHFHDFRTDGIDAKQVKHWLESLGLKALINKRSTSWKNLTESDKQIFDSTDQQQIIKIVLDQPTLIKRPLLQLDDDRRLFIGFSAEQYSSIFK